MILTLKNEEDYIYAFIEWHVVNIDGKYDNNGEYIFIREVWIHKDHRNKGVLHQLILGLENSEVNKTVKYGYWVRHDRRMSKLYTRDHILRRFKNVKLCATY